MEKIFENSWQDILQDEMEKDYYQELRKKLVKEYKTQTIYPDMYDIFNALHHTAYEDVKAVILGQDPYHGPNQANGFAFSVKPGTDLPPSLVNIYKELESDLGYSVPNHGDLTKWADEGVLLLNASLTVRQGEANSHKDLNWERFTDEIIRLLNLREEPIVFILWGNNARQKKKYIDEDKHFIIESVHPSPLAAYRGFFGSKPFSKTNEFLKKEGRTEIDWEIEDKLILDQKHTVEEKHMIGEIPVLRFYPAVLKGKKKKTIIFYHGWSSDKETQRIRAYILASLGYQVILPDAINHGERDKTKGGFKYEDKEVAIEHFWPTVIKNVEESDLIIKHTIDKFNGDKNSIAVMGNSMGGITSSGILVKNPDVNVGVILNGSCNWNRTNDILMEKLGSVDENKEMKELESRLSNYNPYDNKEKLENKSILILHGESDEVVDIRPQIEFYDEMNKYNPKHNFKMIKYPSLNHLVTTNMMEESIIWLGKFL